MMTFTSGIGAQIRATELTAKESVTRLSAHLELGMYCKRKPSGA
jgi:hypothetical protein